MKMLKLNKDLMSCPSPLKSIRGFSIKQKKKKQTRWIPKQYIFESVDPHRHTASDLPFFIEQYKFVIQLAFHR